MRKSYINDVRELVIGFGGNDADVAQTLDMVSHKIHKMSEVVEIMYNADMISRDQMEEWKERRV